MRKRELATKLAAVSLVMILSASIVVADQPKADSLVRQAEKQRERHSEIGYQQAASLYRKAIAISPRSVPAHTGLAITQLIQAKTYLFENDTRRKYLQEGTKHASLALRLAPKSVQANQTVTFAYICSRDFDDAKSALKKTMPLDKTSPLTLTLDGLLQSNPRKREDLLKQALKKSPKDYLALISLGHLYYEAGRGKDAEQVFHHALSSYPESAYVRNAFGAFLVAQGENTLAGLELRKALQLDSSFSTTAAKNLADLFLLTKRPKEAVPVLQNMLKKHPNYTPARISLAAAFASSDQIGASEREHLEASKRDPGNWMAWYNLGSFLLVRGRAREAVPALRKAVDLAPKVAVAHIDLGWGLYMLGSFSEAHSETQKGILIAPDLLLAKYNLGCITLADGKAEEAVAIYEDALKRSGRIDMSKVVGDLFELKKTQPENREINYILGLIAEKHNPEAAPIYYEVYISRASNEPLRQLAADKLELLRKRTEK